MKYPTLCSFNLQIKVKFYARSQISKRIVCIYVHNGPLSNVYKKEKEKKR